MKLADFTMDEVLDFFDHIRVPLSSMERATRQGQYRYYGAQSVIDYIDGYLFDGEYVLIAEDGANLVTRNDPIAFLVDGQFWVNNHAHIVRGKDRKANNYYIAALLNSTNIVGFVTGAAQPKLSQQNLKQIPVRLPSYDVQCRIVDILSSYDELIENNRRRMALLEESARQLYEEWFVRLRFPGCEHTLVVDGVPEGWERRPLGQCVKFLSGGTPSSSNPSFWDGDIPWISSGEMTELRLHDSSRRLTPEGVEQGSRLVPANTILVVVRGMSLAKEFRLAVAARPVAFNQDLKALRCEPDIRSEYLFASLVAQRDQIRDQATDASHGTKKLDTPVLAAVPILLPTEPLQREFCDIVAPMNAQWDNCWRQNERLRAARDLLLPRLMSGEVAV